MSLTLILTLTHLTLNLASNPYRIFINFLCVYFSFTTFFAINGTGQSLLENVVRENFSNKIEDFYDLDNSTVLGSGISGLVRTALCKSSGTLYALKTLPKDSLDSNRDMSDIRKEVRAYYVHWHILYFMHTLSIGQFLIQINIMTRMDHPNILRIHEWWGYFCKTYHLVYIKASSLPLILCSGMYLY